MNREPQILRALLGAIACALIALNSGCGMKGPLYLPASASSASQPSTSPAP